MKKNIKSILSNKWNYLHFLLVLLIFVFLSWSKVVEMASLNRMAVNTSKLVLGNGPTSQAALNKLQNCRKYWFEGFIFETQGERDERDRHWRTAVQCAPEYISMLSFIAPEDRAMADYSVRVHPESSESWFWLAQFEDVRAIEFYERGLALNPTNGLRWKEYGDLLVKEDSELAMEAYLQACLNGDPGYNGCWLAGKMAEQLDDIPRAIRYYRYSRWKGALKRADELEQKLYFTQER